MEEVITHSKKCTRCKKKKPIEHFGLDRQKFDGRRPDCRRCRKKKRGFYNHSKTRKRKPKPRYRSTREYDFLKYIRLVFKWATVEYEIRRPDLEVALYLYSIGAFSKNKFYEYYRTVGMNQPHHFNRLIREGHIVVWRPRKGNESALYVLSNRTKLLCSRMHRICTGEEEIPTSPKKNKLVNDNRRNSQYYINAIKKMNKDK